MLSPLRKPNAHARRRPERVPERSRTTYRLQRALSDRLRGTIESDQEVLLDNQAVRLRVEAVLGKRGLLTNADVKRISGYSRMEALRLVRTVQRDGLLELVGRGRGAYYRPGHKLSARFANAKNAGK